MAIKETADRFRRFSRTEAGHLPVYSRLVSGCADDVDVMTLMEHAPRGQRRPNLLLASVHDILLSGVDHPLAAWYPSVSESTPPGEDPYPAFRDLIDSHLQRVTDDLATKATQTNEPNRSCLWRLAMPQLSREVDVPLAIVELGPSAGLNLCFDRYSYDFDGGDKGLMSCRLRGGAAPEPLDINVSSRVGLDLMPVDLTDLAAVRWLKACIWPEQLERHHRFDTAVSIAALDPPDLRQGDLIDDLPALLAEVGPDHHLVVINSWVLFYVERSRRLALESMLDRHQGDFAALSWVSAEGPGVIAWAGDRDDYLDEPHSVVGWTHWRDGQLRTQKILARCHSHLAWLERFS